MAVYQGSRPTTSAPDELQRDRFDKAPTRHTGKAAKGAASDIGKGLESVQWEGTKTTEPAIAHMGHAHPPALCPPASAGP